MLRICMGSCLVTKNYECNFEKKMWCVFVLTKIIPIQSKVSRGLMVKIACMTLFFRKRQSVIKRIDQNPSTGFQLDDRVC